MGTKTKGYKYWQLEVNKNQSEDVLGGRRWRWCQCEKGRWGWGWMVSRREKKSRALDNIGDWLFFFTLFLVEKMKETSWPWKTIIMIMTIVYLSMTMMMIMMTIIMMRVIIMGKEVDEDDEKMLHSIRFNHHHHFQFSSWSSTE